MNGFCAPAPTKLATIPLAPKPTLSSSIFGAIIMLTSCLGVSLITYTNPIKVVNKVDIKINLKLLERYAINNLWSIFIVVLFYLILIKISLKA